MTMTMTPTTEQATRAQSRTACNEIRQTKIVFTIGPATASEAVVARLIESGVDVCRINMAHADHDWLRSTIAVMTNRESRMWTRFSEPAAEQLYTTMLQRVGVEIERFDNATGTVELA